MIARGTIRFWGEGVGCFCHEAVTRALCDAFGEVTISNIDVAYAKYTRVAEYPTLENSAWYELLRNGPAFTFTLPSGISGRFSRYSIEFDIPDTADSESVAQITRFLDQLSLGRIERD